MRFIAHQLILNPACWIVLGLVLGAWGQWRDRRWLSYMLLGSIFFLLPKPIDELIHQYERSFPNWETHQTPAPYIVVLGAGGTPDPALTKLQQLSGSPLFRVMQGISIAKALPEATLVFSSAGRPGYPSQASMYAAFAKEWGIAETRLDTIPTPTITREEAEHFKARFPEATTVILVSSALHQPRAKRLFERQGLRVIPAPSDYTIRRHPAGNRYEWVPSLQSLQRWNSYLHEKIGMLLLDY